MCERVRVPALRDYFLQRELKVVALETGAMNLTPVSNTLRSRILCNVARRFPPARTRTHLKACDIDFVAALETGPVCADEMCTQANRSPAPVVRKGSNIC